MYIPFDERLGVHPQHEGFTDYARWDFANTPEDHYPLLHYPYFQLYRKQVVKQADLVLAMYLRSEAFTVEQKAANMDLRDVEHNLRWRHMASLAGPWMAVVAGFGGMRAGVGQLMFSPRLPAGIPQLRFRMRYRGRKLRVTITPEQARYELLAGKPVAVVHHGKEFELGKRPSEHDIPM